MIVALVVIVGCFSFTVVWFVLFGLFDLQIGFVGICWCCCYFCCLFVL